MLPVANGVTENSWRLISIPVEAIPGITADNAKFSEIRLFGDNPGIMYVGRIAVVVDTTPIKVEPLSDMSVEVRKPYKYVASATAGPSPLVYSWDWDSTDGIQEESVGRTVTHTYYKEGDMTGTLTVQRPVRRESRPSRPRSKSTFICRTISRRDAEDRDTAESRKSSLLLFRVLICASVSSAEEVFFVISSR